VAGAQACGDGVRLKWPNDLLLDGGKLGGILVERRGTKCIVGMGINLRWAPPGASMLGMDRDELLERLRAELGRWFAAPDDEILAAWRARSDTLGSRVRVVLSGESYEDVAEDIAPDGSLVVGGRAFAAGDVIHVRPADATGC